MIHDAEPTIGRCPDDHIVRIHWEGPKEPASRAIRFSNLRAALGFAERVHWNNAGVCEETRVENGAHWFIGRGFGGRIEVSVRHA